MSLNLFYHNKRESVPLSQCHHCHCEHKLLEAMFFCACFHFGEINLMNWYSLNIILIFIKENKARKTWRQCDREIKKCIWTLYSVLQPSSLWFKLSFHGLRPGDHFLAQRCPSLSCPCPLPISLSGTRSLTWVTINSKRRLYYL